MNNKSPKMQYLFILPSLIISLIVIYLPIIYSLLLSMFNGQLNNKHFVGIQNYRNLFEDDVYISTLLNSIRFVLIIVPVILVICIFISMLLHQIENEKWKSFFSSVIYLPCITSPVAYALFFKQLAYSDGILSNVLASLGAKSTNVLQDDVSATIYISLICVWAWSGFYILILFSALENIDKNIFSAAMIDGSSKIRTYFKVVFPTISPVIILIVILTICSTFQIYVEVALITKGGPGESTYTLSLYLYRKFFTYVADYGYSSTIGISILLINIIFSVVILRLRKIRDNR